MNNYAYLGVVRDRALTVLATDGDAAGPYRLTSLPVTTQQQPEGAEIPTAEYEGSAILVRGYHQGRWIYSAVVVEKAGLILTAAVQKIFTSAEGSGPLPLGFPFA